MPNQLIHANSLYLKQHAENPVDWHSWEGKAFEKAKAEDKPVIVSIGYSACHWCHVMEHECFENEYIASLMNRHFICIKVDREEHPEVDQLYMEALQMITGHGGWPLNMFCLPDGRPFFGGTYFPAEDRGRGVIPWPQLLMRVVDHYQKHRDDLLENANNICKNLETGNYPFEEPESPLENKSLVGAADAILKEHDEEWGGFGSAPKFPPSMAIEFLLQMRSTKVSDSIPGFNRKLDAAIPKTLSAMARGGMYDQVGGGFARYSVDRQWLIPHFEKMLYDNALLLEAYLQGTLRYQNPLYEATIKETLEWLEREMRLPEGGYAASIDADSPEGEGRYYVWTPEQIKEVLGNEEAERFCDAYHITSEGNFEEGFSNPAYWNGDFEERQALQPAREKLLKAREERTPPTRDHKMLLAWNALLARAMSEIGYYLEQPVYIQRARDLLEYLWQTMCDEGHQLRSVAYNGQPSAMEGKLDDYAYLADACLSLASKIDTLEPGLHETWLARAQQLSEIIEERFADSDQPGYFYTASDAPKLATRKKEWIDNATPSGNSTMVHVLSQLSQLTGENQYEKRLNSLRKAYAPFVMRAPQAIGYALAGFTADAMGIPLIKIKDVNVLPGLQKSLVGRPWRRTYLKVTRDPQQPEDYILCVGSTCQPPTENPHIIAEMV